MEEIKLAGYTHHATFDTIISRHARPSLRRLEIRPVQYPPSAAGDHFYFSRGRLETLQKLAPNLEELEIPIYRTQGDPEEVAIYRVLGNMRKLRRVGLGLNCIDGLYTRALEKGSEELLLGDFLTNAAIDMDLTRAVFKLVFPKMAACSETPAPELDGWNCVLSLSPEVDLNLEHIPMIVRATPRGVDERGYRLAQRPGYELMNQCWVVGSVDNEGELEIEESSTVTRGPCSGRYHNHRRNRCIWFNVRQEKWREIWREIWPGQEDGGDRCWFTRWSSLPLQLE